MTEHEPFMNPAALYDALKCASLATLVCEETDPECARKGQEALWEASIAAVEAFPPGSPEAGGLNLILGAIERAAASGVSV